MFIYKKLVFLFFQDRTLFNMKAHFTFLFFFFKCKYKEHSNKIYLLEFTIFLFYK